MDLCTDFRVPRERAQSWHCIASGRLLYHRRSCIIEETCMSEGNCIIRFIEGNFIIGLGGNCIIEMYRRRQLYHKGNCTIEGSCIIKGNSIIIQSNSIIGGNCIKNCYTVFYQELLHSIIIAGVQRERM